MSEHEILTLEANADKMSNPSQLSQQGMDSRSMCKQLLSGLNHRKFDYSAVQFRCDCSAERARMGASLLPKRELFEMAEIRENVEIRCEFCANTFRIDPRELI